MGVSCGTRYRRAWGLNRARGGLAKKARFRTAGKGAAAGQTVAEEDLTVGYVDTVASFVWRVVAGMDGLSPGGRVPEATGKVK